MIGHMRGHVISARNVHSQSASFAACVAAMYSASVMDNAMIGCFLELQDTAPPSIVKMYPDVEWQ